MGPAAKTTGGSDSISPSRERILKTAKSLFAARGYEHSTTSSIARAAGTSETQMVKYFGGKQGILEAIFTVGWKESLIEVQQGILACRSPDEKIAALIAGFEAVMSRDPELKLLMLLEGRRIRKEGQFIVLTPTFLAFVKLFDEVLSEMQGAGMLRSDLDLRAIRSALMGMLEGLLRDSVLAQKANYPAHYETAEITRVLFLVIGSFAPFKDGSD
jgi:AcrR family transcriptional regulator